MTLSTDYRVNFQTDVNVPNDVKAKNISQQTGYDPRSTISSATISPFPPAAVAAKLSLEGDIEIPLFDLNEIENADAVKKQALIQCFCKALENVGFLAIKAADLTPYIQAAEKEMKSYFAQKFEEKMKDWHGNNGQTGYNPLGNETPAGAKVPDNKELYFIPPNFTKWPMGKPGFEKAMTAYHQELALLAERVMGYVAVYLGVEKEQIAGGVSTAHNLLRLAHYLPSMDTEAPWAGEHTDLNLITLLPRTEVPGLQLLTKEGEWKKVVVPEGYLIVNTAEQLEFLTAGKIKATPHRVLNPGGVWSRMERHSTIFFASQGSNFILDPLKDCVMEMTAGMNSEESAAYLKKYPQGVTVQENLLGRLIEMGTIKAPGAELVAMLASKGLLRKPPKNIVELYPEVFAAASVQ